MKVTCSTSIRIALFASLLAGSVGASLMAGAQDQSSQAPADNTRMNRGDQNPSAVTADQQKMDKADRDITRQIRRSIEKDKSLSTYAHNVKVITQNGMVTLKGPVRSEDEKRAIEAKAAEVAGADKVTNETEVQPKQ